MQSKITSLGAGMGEQKAFFGPNRANAKIILYVLPVFLLVGIVLVSRLPIGSIAMFLVAAGMFWGYRAQMRARVAVCEQGLAAVDWLGRSHSFRWEQVTGVYEFVGYHQRTRRPNQWVYTVHLQDGRQVRLDMAYEKTHSLGHIILAETGRAFLPAALEAFRAGGTVSFGEAIAVSPQGFVANGQVLPWEQVAKATINRSGDLSLHKKDQRLFWKLVMHPRIANFPTFRAFLHEIIRETPAQAALEDPLYDQARKRDQPGPRANIGSVSSAIGVDVRELLMDGYTMEEIHRVVHGEISLAELRQVGPKAGRK